jgi:hypothetical protein
MIRQVEFEYTARPRGNRMPGSENEKSRNHPALFISKLAEPTGFEPATSDVTGSKPRFEIWLSYTRFSTLENHGI